MKQKAPSFNGVFLCSTERLITRTILHSPQMPIARAETSGESGNHRLGSGEWLARGYGSGHPD